jgi:hypothetical protein
MSYKGTRCLYPVIWRLMSSKQHAEEWFWQTNPIVFSNEDASVSQFHPALIPFSFLGFMLYIHSMHWHDSGYHLGINGGQ